MIAKVIYWRVSIAEEKCIQTFFCAPRLLGIMVVWGAEEGRRYWTVASGRLG